MKKYFTLLFCLVCLSSCEKTYVKDKIKCLDDICVDKKNNKITGIVIQTEKITPKPLDAYTPARSPYFVETKTPYVDGKKHGIEKIYQVEKNGEKTLDEEYSYMNGKKNGMYKKYIGKVVLYDIPYKNDKKNGIGYTYLWDDKNNRHIIAKTNYKDDLEEGEYTSYFMNGEINYKGFYKKGHMEGISISYCDNGKVNSETFFTNGKKEGIAKIYNCDDGHLIEKTNYKNGKKHGIHEEYSKTDGIYPYYYLSKRTIYNNDEMKDEKQYYSSGALFLERNDKGNYKSYSPYGRVEEEWKKVNNKNIGKKYNYNGKLKSEDIRFLEGNNLVIIYKEYYDNGGIKRITTYKGEEKDIQEFPERE